MTTRRIWVVVGSLTLVAAACGGSDDSSTEATTPATPAPTDTTEAPATTSPATTSPATTTPATTDAAATTAPATPTTEAGSGGIAGFADVQPAVIQVIATGAFRDPEVGQQVGAGSGSGFIISPDGYAVTNNHVVTGAATLEVYVGGELDDSYNAQIVGVSECNDLALIKIAQDDLPYLDWSDAEPTVGQELYAAGFPLGDPEFTMTRGIVAKADADGETPWASIDHTIQHDAQTQPGNSGGPLVGEDGKVVGVHYASGDFGTGTSQFYGISSDLAQDVVDQLMDGDFESLGINGSAVWDEAAGISGIWVAAVDAGSPASDVGLKPGDIITSLNGLPMATDGTMREYCDVIRTAGEGQPMAIQVLSWDDQAVYEGEINNPDRPLVEVASFADENVEEGTAYTYQAVNDALGWLTVELPATWAIDDQTDGQKPSIWASPDLQGFIESWDVPGMKLTLFPETRDIAELLDLMSQQYDFGGSCASSSTVDYDDGVFVGAYNQYEGCGTAGSGYVILVTHHVQTGVTVTMEWQYVTQADLDALSHAMATFNIVL